MTTAHPKGRLSVVATPIGNLEDMTLRALRTLKEADFVACEDTRQTRKLLSHFDIHTPAIVDRKVLPLLAQGKHVALVSDAGTPGVSDPGLELVARAREAGAKIEAIVGPSALAGALSIAGLRVPSFTFYGFLPQKKGREKLFKEIAASERSSIFFESPHRILKTLASLETHLGASRRIGVYRELTKIHEEAIVGTPAEVLAVLVETPEKQRGEFVVIVESI
jgi:16S rRNA (cytidine1402-2'-O)-methyltransferase